MGNIESNDRLDTASTTPAIQIMAIWALALIPRLGASSTPS